MLSNNIALAESTKAHPWERPQAKKIRDETAPRSTTRTRKWGWIRATTFEGALQGAWRVPPRGGHEGEKGLKPPWSPSQAPLKSFLSPLEALLKPPSSPLHLEAPFKPFSSPLEALLKPPWSPLQASHLQAPWSPSQAPLKPSQAPLKPPWTGLKPRKPPSSPSKAPRPAPGNPSKPFPKGSFM